ncbi:MAG: sulfite exporter TauE/SafE family protein [Victivallales bacterium]|nr:sulfite exporter TauE/SafE family protein [Victivallales bacterium]
MFFVLLVLGCFGGFLSGMLGLGGAVVMIPFMLFIPPLLGFPELTMKTVAGLSMIQVLAASTSGMVIHKKNKFIDKEAFLNIGIPMAVFAYLGGHFSRYLDDLFITVLFGLIVIIAFLMLLFHKEKGDTVDSVEGYQREYDRLSAAIVGVVIGSFSGIVGAGGGFILVPIMIIILKIPIRLTIGTSLSIVFLGAIMGAAGKIISMQVNYPLALAIVISSIPSAVIGAKVSKKLPRKILKYLLLIVIFVSMLQVWFKILNAVYG